MKTIAACMICLAAPVLADAPTVQHAVAQRDSMGWRIEVTLSHGDTGWDHYADTWEVTNAAGERLALRQLAHPHVNEQPFTRSLSHVMLPDGTQVIFIRATCSKGGAPSPAYRIELPR